MTIKGINCDLSHEATIILLKGSDGKYYAQSSALCKADTPDTAVRRCVKCMTDYDFARRYDMYQNGDLGYKTVEELDERDTAPRRRNEDLHRCL